MYGTGGTAAILEASRDLTSEQREAEFARLIDGGLDRSYRVARLVLRNDADAEDAVQDAVVAAWRQWRELKDHARFDAWFGRILLNRCRDRLRRSDRRTVDLSAHLARDTHDFERTEQRLDIGRAFDQLNADQRIAVVLRYWSDLTVEQIADRMHVPAGTVKSRLHHALARLRRELDDPEAAP